MKFQDILLPLISHIWDQFSTDSNFNYNCLLSYQCVGEVLTLIKIMLLAMVLGNSSTGFNSISRILEGQNYLLKTDFCRLILNGSKTLDLCTLLSYL